MIKVVACGFLGQMGQAMEKLIKERENMELVGGVSRSADSYQGEVKVYKDILDFDGECDVIIDFSHPDALDHILEYATTNNTALVLATTGYNDKDMAKIQEAAKVVPVFYSANTSLGINLLLSLVSKAASILGDDFDIEIVERHHNKKIDSPSGTAYMIADKINEVFENNKVYTFGRHTKTNRRTSKEIGIHAVRGGTYVGEHDIIFAGLDEVVEINHRALSKNVFGKGALVAAEFIVTKDKGLYNMNDVIS